MCRFYNSLIVALILGTVTFSFADEPKQEKSGWFWYDYSASKVEPQENESKPSPVPDKKDLFIPKLSDYTYEELMEMHPKQLSVIYEGFHEKMVQSPTLENAVEYQIIKEISRRKASAAAAAVTLVAQKYPDLDAQNDYPMSNAGRTAFQKQRTEEIGSAILAASENYGILYFYRTDCPYCDAMFQTIVMFINKYGWELKTVDAKAEPETAAAFNIEIVPSVIIVSRSSGESMPITAGVITLSEFENRLYRAIRFLGGDNPADVNTYKFQQGAMDGSKPINFPDEFNSKEALK